MGATLSLLVIATAVATVGFWTYHLIWSAPQPLPAVASDSTPEAEQQRVAAIEEAQRQAKAAADAETKLKAAEIEQQRLQEEVQGQAKAATELQTKLQAAQAEQQRQAKAAADADGKRRAAEAEQQRLKDEVQRQTKAATDADAKLKAALTEQQRLVKAATDADAKRGAAEAEQQRQVATKVPFEYRINTNAIMTRGAERSTERIPSILDCEAKCARSLNCKIFSYNKEEGICYTYSNAELLSDEDKRFDSGIRK